MPTRRTVLRSAAAGALVGAGVTTGIGSVTALSTTLGDGVNLQPAYFCGGGPDLGWGLMNQYRDSIHTLRIELEPPERGETQADMHTTRSWIDEGYQEGYEILATYHHHPHNGSPDPTHLQYAADWWVEHYDFLSANADFTINLMNEWGDHDVTADEWASAYNDAIDTIRAGTDYTGPIVIDAPGWAQNVHAAAEGVNQIDDDNIIVSIHVYGVAHNAGAGEPIRPTHLDYLADQGYPCIIGEWGTNAPGDTETAAVVSHANDLGWPVIAWAWNGDGTSDGSGLMNMAEPYWTDGACSGPYSESWYFWDVIDYLHGGPEDDGVGDGEPFVDECADLSLLADGSETGSLEIDTSNEAYFDHPDGGTDPTRITRSNTTGGVWLEYAPEGDLSAYELAVHVQQEVGGDITIHELIDDNWWSELDPERVPFGDDDGSWDAELLHGEFSADATRLGISLHGGWRAWSPQLGRVVIERDGDGGSAVPAPTNLHASDVGSSYVTLVWDEPDGVDQYAVYVDGNHDHDVWDQNWASVDGLQSDTEYTFGVAAVLDGQESERDEITVRTESRWGWW